MSNVAIISRKNTTHNILFKYFLPQIDDYQCDQIGLFESKNTEFLTKVAQIFNDLLGQFKIHYHCRKNCGYFLENLGNFLLQNLVTLTIIAKTLMGMVVVD